MQELEKSREKSCHFHQFIISFSVYFALAHKKMNNKLHTDCAINSNQVSIYPIPKFSLVEYLFLVVDSNFEYWFSNY